MASELSDALLQALARGETQVSLPPGRYAAGVGIAHSVRILAEGPGVSLHPPAGGPVLWLAEDGVTLELQGLRLTGGHDEAGGALHLRAFSEVRFDACTIDGCHSREGAGHALYADAGTLSLSDCQVGAEAAGSAVLITGVATLNLRGGGVANPLGDALCVREEGLVSATDASLSAGHAGLKVAGSRSQRPEITWQGGHVAGAPALALQARHPGKVRIQDAEITGEVEGVYVPRIA